MRIAFMVEGATEKVFMRHLQGFLRPRLKEMPRFQVNSFDGPIPRGDRLRRRVKLLLGEADAVIALTDVYTGHQPPEFESAANAKQKLKEWVGDEPDFYPHAAQFDFEAWLLPYWNKITALAGSNRQAPGNNPETVNNMSPPSRRIQEVFRTGTRKRGRYVKPRDASKILEGEDLNVAVQACQELKSLVNTILKLCNGTAIP